MGNVIAIPNKRDRAAFLATKEFPNRQQVGQALTRMRPIRQAVDNWNTGMLCQPLQGGVLIDPQHEQIDITANCAGEIRQCFPPTEADLVARFSFGVGPARDRIGTRPAPSWSAWGWYGRPWVGPGWHPWMGSRFYDPFWGSAFGPSEVYTFTDFPAFAEIDIAPAKGRRNVFEGRAETSTRQPGLPGVVPRLIDALFVDFPGVSGETRRVTLPAGG